eukprot:SAG22_NODE_142_length_17922_cov_10.990406_8_plen_74_part_00
MDKQKMQAELESALSTEKESAALGGVAGWRKLEDLFFAGECANECFELPEEEPESGSDEEESVREAREMINRN